MELVWNARRAAALMAAFALAGCGGGGGGGGSGAAPAGGLILPSEGTPVAAAALTTSPVVADPANPSLLDALVGALVFPLYPLRATAVAEGTRTERTDGSLTITYRSSTGPRSFTFAPGEFTSRTSESFIAEKGMSTLYSEFWADAAQGWRLDHSRVGTFFFDDSGRSQVQLFYFGAETPAAQMPTSPAPNLGTAQYDGKTFGYVFGANPGTLSGDVRLLLNFAADRFTGVITNLTTESVTGGTQPLGVSFVVDTAADDARITREAIGGSITGRIAAIDDASDTRLSCCGNIVGRFFGPNARELTGGWLYDVNDLSIRAVFGTRRPADWYDGTALSFLSNDVVIRATYANVLPGTVPTIASEQTLSDASPLATTLRPESDGGITWRFGGGPQITLPGDAFATEASPFTTPYPVMQTRQVANEDGFAMHVAGEGYLSYARFGYWEDSTVSTLDRMTGFFAAGRETPLAQMPATGIATYSGATLGMGLSGDGLARLTGALAMTVNFDTRTMSGEITNLRAEYLATAPGATPGNTFAISTLRMSTLNIVGNGFAGPAGGFVGSGAGETAVASGTMKGQFFGPQAQEIAGKWEVQSPTESIRAWGAFGATR